VSGWLGQGGLPLGAVLLLSLLYASLRHKSGFRRAATALPELGQELGLEYSPPRYARSQGSLTGRYLGRVVRVDPDEQRAILIRFAGAPSIDLRSYERPQRAAPGMKQIRSGDAAFDDFWKTRFASQAIARRIEESELPSRLSEPFKLAYWRNLRSLSVTESGITCVLDFGNPPYIPADALRVLLPALSALADFVEDVSRARSAPAAGSEGEAFAVAQGAE
jgi:hypothetical protein